MINFPDTPTIGQEVYSDTKKYTWDGEKWKVSATTDWIRSSEWLTLPTITSTDEKFVGLYAVFPNPLGIESNPNFIALAALDAYTVNWGDGVIENFVGNTNAYHIYNYDNIPNSTLCSRGYKQVIVTLTPVTGNQLKVVNLSVRHFRAPQNYVKPWLDMSMSFPNATGITIDGSTSSMVMLERVQIFNIGTTTSFTYFLYGMYQLQSVYLPDTSKVLYMNLMFGNCSSLKSVPYMNTSIVTTMTSMFNACYCLKTVPLYNTSNVTDMSGMFASCAALTSIPLYDTTKVTTMDYMLNGCTSLVESPAFNTPNCLSFSSFNRNNFSLLKMGALDTSKASSVSLIAYNCPSLLELPALNVAKAVTMYQMFDGSPRIRASGITNARFTHTYNSFNLAAPAITTIMNNLLSLPTFAVTFTDSGDLITAPSHGLINGNTNATIRFTSINNTTGILINTNYYVVNSTTNTFQVSLTVGGAAIALTTDGTGICCISSTITISGNIGAPTPISYSNCATTAGSKSITVTNAATNVTFTGTTNLVTTAIANGFLPNQKVTFQTVITTTGVTANTTYYVVNISSTTIFQLSLTANGSPITFTSGTGTMLLTPLDSQVTGTGSPLTIPIVMAFTSNKVVLTNHQLSVDDKVSFPTLTNNLVTYTPYYIVGTPNANDFQISATLGGTALTFTDGVGSMLYDSTLVSISGTTSPFTFNMSRPMTTTVSSSSSGTLTNYVGNGTTTVTCNGSGFNFPAGSIIYIAGGSGTEQAKLNVSNAPLGYWIVTSASSTSFTFVCSQVVTAGTYTTGLGTLNVNTLSFRILKTSIALMKNWTVA